MNSNNNYKKIGILGGMGHESTTMYYQGIHNLVTDEFETKGYPEIVILSLNLRLLIELVGSGKWDKVAELLSSRVEQLEKLGCDFCAMASNTPHFVFEKLEEKAKIPMISIIKETYKEAKRKGLKKCLLLATKFTMSNDTFQRVFKDVELVLPAKEDVEYIHEKLFSELEKGIVKEETREGYLEIVRKAKKEHKIDSVILGCTEIPLLLPKEEYEGIPTLNTSNIHIQSIVNRMKLK